MQVNIARSNSYIVIIVNNKPYFSGNIAVIACAGEYHNELAALIFLAQLLISLNTSSPDNIRITAK